MWNNNANALNQTLAANMNEKRRYRAEYAKSSKGTCKDRDCSGRIQKGELRLAIVLKVVNFVNESNKTTNSECLCFFDHFSHTISTVMKIGGIIRNVFFQKYKVKSEFSIDGFARLRYEDQEELRRFMGKNCFVNFSTDHLNRP